MPSLSLKYNRPKKSLQGKAIIFSGEIEMRRFRWIELVMIWGLTGLPLSVFSWYIIPTLAETGSRYPSDWYWLGMAVNGCILFLFSFLILYREQGRFNLIEIKKRIRLVMPVFPGNRTFLWGVLFYLVPVYVLFLLSLILSLGIIAVIPVAFLTWPSFSNPFELASIEHAGRWFRGIMVLCAWIINAGSEELLFRGILLPRMDMKKSGWFRNAFWYSIYNIHKPWSIPFRLIDGIILAWPGSGFKSLWVPVSTRTVEGICVAVLIWIGVASVTFLPLPVKLPDTYIETRPIPETAGCEILKSLPDFDPGAVQRWEQNKNRNLQNKDLSALDLRSASKLLSGANFDTLTRWPLNSLLPENFDPERILEMGKNPGLGIRELHKRGITGRGVSIAVIDNALPVDHFEYGDRLRWYEEIHSTSVKSTSMHGPAVASIAAGKTVGVAPEADLYYISDRDRNFEETVGGWSNRAAAIRRLFRINERLPPSKKIRVISISMGWNPGVAGYYDIQSAVREAQEKGIMVVCATNDEIGRFDFSGLSRNATADPDNFESWEPSVFMRVAPSDTGKKNILWVPCDSRTTASGIGSNEYTYSSQGGVSWGVPYLAGAYALACQVDPGITPEKFWIYAIETGRIISADYKGRQISLGPILDMAALVRKLQKKIQ